MQRLIFSLPLLLACAACIPPVRSSDYDVAFARAYSRDRTPAEWERPPRELSVEQLYALQQYGRRAFHPWRTVSEALGCRGGEAIPFLKAKITPQTLGSLLEAFRWMRWMETYDVAADANLLSRIETAYREMPGALRRGYSEELAVVTGRPLPAGSRLAPPGSPAELRRRYCP